MFVHSIHAIEVGWVFCDCQCIAAVCDDAVWVGKLLTVRSWSVGASPLIGALASSPAGSAASSPPNGMLAPASCYKRMLRVLPGPRRDAAGPAGEDASAPAASSRVATSGA